MADLIYFDDDLEVFSHPANIPWVKIFTAKEQLELSDNEQNAAKMFAAALKIERAMREFYAVRKINHASFANELPRAHWHVMARFERDAWWPHNVWQQPLREGTDCRGDWAAFCELLRERLAAR